MFAILRGVTHLAPWHVLHVEDGDALEDPMPDGAVGAFVVVWAHEAPLGHAWVPFDGPPLTRAEAVARARRSIVAPPETPERCAGPGDPRPSVAVVIPTRDRAELL